MAITFTLAGTVFGVSDVRVEFSENIKPLDSTSVTTDVPGNGTALDYGGLSVLQGIWTLNVNGTIITIDLNQSGKLLSGRCKSDSMGWNGIAAGSASSSELSLAISHQEAGQLVVTCLHGTFSGDVINGTVAQLDDHGSAFTGRFIARRVSTSVDGYSPAVITSASSNETGSVSTEATSDAPDVIAYPEMSHQKFTNVRTLASGIDPNILPRHAPL